MVAVWVMMGETVGVTVIVAVIELEESMLTFCFFINVWSRPY